MLKFLRKLTELKGLLYTIKKIAGAVLVVFVIITLNFSLSFYARRPGMHIVGEESILPFSSPEIIRKLEPVTIWIDRLSNILPTLVNHTSGFW